MTIQISAIICTHNRAEYLRQALNSLIHQTLSPAQYEIIVVDNASTDHSRQVVDGFSAPNLSYINEPVLGLSKARNTAWQNAQAPYVAYLDDDAVASPTWLEKYLDVFTSFSPSPTSVGGKCEPIWEVPQPAWLSDKMLTTLSVYDWSSDPIVLNADQWLTGCNIAYRVDALRDHGGFREDLGRIGKRLLSGEETYLRRQFDAAGQVTVYHPEIAVGHHISPSRLNKAWFRRHAYGTGQTDAFMLKLQHPISFVKRIGLGLKKVMWVVPRLPLIMIAPQQAERFRRQYQVLEAFGYVTGLWNA